MRFFQNLPIQRKLVAITMLASTVALLTACAAFVTYEQVTARKRLVSELTVTARMTGLNSAAGLTFNEPGSVEQSLQSLRAEPTILAAWVYDAKGRPFAHYERSGTHQGFAPPTLQPEGHRFNQNRLELFQTIHLADEPAGSIYLCQDLEELNARIWRYMLIVGLVLPGSALLGFFLAARWHKVISEPLKDLARTVTLVAEQNNYSVRAVRTGADEVGRLIDGFNHMLAQIQSRDKDLEAARATLEHRVQERTQELAYQRDLLQSLLDNLPDTIFFKDLQSRFVHYSKSLAQRFRLARPEALRGKTDADFFTPEHARPALEDEQAILHTGQPILTKVERETHLDGRLTWALTSKMPWRDKDGRIIGTFGISKDITAMKAAEAKLEAVHRDLVTASRQAGMAEVATSVLHNVGNVLNSVNVSASLISQRLRTSSLSGLRQTVARLEQQRDRLPAFLAEPDRAEQLRAFLTALAKQLEAEQAQVLAEAAELAKNIEHIKEIVALQQNYAKLCGVIELVSLPALVEDALRMHLEALARHGVRVVREFDTIPEVPLDKHKVLQILVNLISNAKYALSHGSAPDRVLTLRIARLGANRVCVAVRDNGMGIAPENLTRIFSHGFTTRRNGHGFGLHSGALAAREMGGTLLAHSAGLNQGATFTLELPLPSNARTHER